jgi:hypothetical protein
MELVLNIDVGTKGAPFTAVVELLMRGTRLRDFSVLEKHGDTAVVGYEKLPCGAWRRRVYELSDDLGEDCIAALATRGPGAGRGLLIGPDSADWEPFRMELFSLPKGSPPVFDDWRHADDLVMQHLLLDVYRAAVEGGSGVPGWVFQRNAGICHNTKELAFRRRVWGDGVSARLKHAFEEMGLDPNYPVAHPTMSNQAAYDSIHDVWRTEPDDYTPEEDVLYAIARFDLLGELIERFTPRF